MQLTTDNHAPFKPVTLKLESLDELLAIMGAAGYISGATVADRLATDFIDLHVDKNVAARILMDAWKLLKDESKKYGEYRHD